MQPTEKQSMSDVSACCVGNLVSKVDEWSRITSDPWTLQIVQAYRLDLKTKATHISEPKGHFPSKYEC